MRARWFSKRALSLHLAVIIWVPSCLIAGWWQVTRALDGNGLSYLYSVEWPVFAIVGVGAWWVLIHTDPETVGARAQRRLQRLEAQTSASTPASAARRREDEDEALSAYNDQLSALASANVPKTWRRT
jgi:DNA-binding transcriptional regulator of glucitol operon